MSFSNTEEKLNELKIKLAGEEWGDIKDKKKRETEVFILEEEREDLKRMRDEWGKQLRNLQNKTTKFEDLNGLINLAGYGMAGKQINIVIQNVIVGEMSCRGNVLSGKRLVGETVSVKRPVGETVVGETS
ncbi:5430_t:CDS:2, partial [Entrophospora sp. SA101]